MPTKLAFTVVTCACGRMPYLAFINPTVCEACAVLYREVLLRGKKVAPSCLDGDAMNKLWACHLANAAK